MHAAFIAALTGAPCSAEPVRHAPIEEGSQSANDLVVRGRVLNETSSPISPVSHNTVILASHYTYRLRVKHIIRGKERSSEIVATWDRDGTLLRDRDFIFHLTRKPDGSYDVKGVDRVG